MIIIVVNSTNNYLSEQKLAKLVNLAEKQEVAVFRGSDRESETIDFTELMVGDVYQFSQGMKAPADSIVLEGQDIECDEVELTGEPDAITKMPIDSSNYLEGGMCTMMAKSLIVKGSGRALVLAVGRNTVAGVITEKTQVESEPTLLQQKLTTVADKIGKFGIACAVLTFCAMLIRCALEMMTIIPCGCQNIMTCVEVEGCDNLSFAFTLKNRLWNEVLNTIIIAITIIVVAIPEGLPLAVTISLSFSSAKMMELNNLVRNLASSETMGGATHICSDKTGTLTETKMTVMACLTGQKLFIAKEGDPQKNSKVLSNEVSSDDVGKQMFEDLSQGVMWNSTARIEKNKETGEFELHGNVTEQGLIKFFVNVLDYKGCNDLKLELAEENVLQVISFSSKRKRASIVIKKSDGSVRVFTKGAPDMLFDKLAGVQIGNNVCELMDESTQPA